MQKIVCLDRLKEIGKNAVADSLLREIKQVKAGQQNDARRQAARFDLFGDLKPGEKRHLDIQNCKIRLQRLDFFHGVPAVCAGGKQGEIGLLLRKQALEPFQNEKFIVGDQKRVCLAHCYFSLQFLCGMQNTTFVPQPGLLCTASP